MRLLSRLSGFVCPTCAEPLRYFPLFSTGTGRIDALSCEACQTKVRLRPAASRMQGIGRHAVRLAIAAPVYIALMLVVHRMFAEPRLPPATISMVVLGIALFPIWGSATMIALQNRLTRPIEKIIPED